LVVGEVSFFRRRRCEGEEETRREDGGQGLNCRLCFASTLGPLPPSLTDISIFLSSRGSCTGTTSLRSVRYSSALLFSFFLPSLRPSSLNSVPPFFLADLMLPFDYSQTSMDLSPSMLISLDFDKERLEGSSGREFVGVELDLQPGPISFPFASPLLSRSLLTDTLFSPPFSKMLHRMPQSSSPRRGRFPHSHQLRPRFV